MNSFERHNNPPEEQLEQQIIVGKTYWDYTPEERAEIFHNGSAEAKERLFISHEQRFIIEQENSN